MEYFLERMPRSISTSYRMVRSAIWDIFFEFFLFPTYCTSRRRVQYVGNKKNEKNISHIARRCHAITSLSLGIIYLFILDSSIFSLLTHLFQGKLNIWKLENLSKFFGCIVCETSCLAGVILKLNEWFEKRRFDRKFSPSLTSLS